MYTKKGQKALSFGKTFGLLYFPQYIVNLKLSQINEGCLAYLTVHYHAIMSLYSPKYRRFPQIYIFGTIYPVYKRRG